MIVYFELWRHLIVIYKSNIVNYKSNIIKKVYKLDRYVI